MNVANARKLLQKVGEVMEIENPIVNGNLLRNFIRGRVKIDLNRPLPAGCWAPKSNLPNLWIVYRYERLQALCFKCGIIGHDQKSCQNTTIMFNFNPTSPKYGPGFSVSALRSIHYLGRSQDRQSSSSRPNNQPQTTSNSIPVTHNTSTSPNQMARPSTQLTHNSPSQTATIPQKETQTDTTPQTKSTPQTHTIPPTESTPHSETSQNHSED